MIMSRNRQWMVGLLSVGLMIGCGVVPGTAQTGVFARDFIGAIADKVNTYQYTHPSPYSNDNWIRGTYYTGVMAMYQATGDKRYLDQCIAWGEKTHWQIPKKETNVYGSGFYSLVCGQTWIECYLDQQEDYMLRPTIDHLEDPARCNPVTEPLTWHYENSGLRFVDGLYTSPPALAMLYQVTQDEKYLDWMDASFWDTYGVLYDKDEGLFYRDARYRIGTQEHIESHYIRPDSIPREAARTMYIYQQTEHGKKVLWSRGNGWAFGGLTRILKYLPPDHGNYERYKALYVRMAYELKTRQQSDGFWRPNLTDPDDYGYTESSGTSFFTYGITWGINNGILPREDFLPVIEKSWAAVVSVISPDGKVQWCQPAAGAPFKVEQDDSREYASGMFLLAASELFRLEW